MCLDSNVIYDTDKFRADDLRTSLAVDMDIKF